MVRGVVRGPFAHWRRLSGAQLFALSFALLIGLGTVVLRLVPGLVRGDPVTWLEAGFTATSAVCVTGLTVVDTATRFTPAGQAVLLGLIQLGGLGMVAFTTLVILAVGGRLSLRQEALARGAADIAPHIDVRALSRDVIRFTIVIEAVGAALLYIGWVPQFGWRDALWPAVFHAVSAFCNAGFSTFSTSLAGPHGSPWALLVITGLVLAGGLGFLTLEEIVRWRRTRQGQRGARLSLHSRLVLTVTLGLTVVGGVAFAMFERHASLSGAGQFEAAVQALFLSVTPRTAGFASLPYAHLTESSLLLTLVLMVIGGSPGSTAGGIKTTTFALLGLLAIARARGRDAVGAWHRTVPAETIQRAVGLFVAAAACMLAGLFLLSWTEVPARGGATFLPRLFEVVSAFNTVGLSMDLTPSLTAPGRGLLLILMFVGRVGPLTLGLALLRRSARREQYRYAAEDVIVG